MGFESIFGFSNKLFRNNSDGISSASSKKSFFTRDDVDRSPVTRKLVGVINYFKYRKQRLILLVAGFLILKIVIVLSVILIPIIIKNHN